MHPKHPFTVPALKKVTYDAQNNLQHLLLPESALFNCSLYVFARSRPNCPKRETEKMKYSRKIRFQSQHLKKATYDVQNRLSQPLLPNKLPPAIVFCMFSPVVDKLPIKSETETMKCIRSIRLRSQHSKKKRHKTGESAKKAGTWRKNMLKRIDVDIENKSNWKTFLKHNQVGGWSWGM